MYDLHTHTYYSDGTDSPREVIQKAKAAGLRLVGITDHDTMAGIPEAIAAARRASLPLLCGAEIEAQYAPAKLHILALGADHNARCIKDLLALQAKRRAARNAEMLCKLGSMGMDVRPYYRTGRGCATRTHIANALVAAGYAESVSDAFARIIGRGQPGFINCEHPSIRETIECITEAGGRAVLAHPHKMKCDHESLVREMVSCGLWGLEAYYPGSGPETMAYFIGLANRYGLNITCGSDYHGANRPSSPIGCAWQDVPELEASYEALKELCIKPVMSFDEFEDAVGEIASELPDGLFDRLNGGIVVRREAKLHEKSLPEQPLYIEGQYMRSAIGRQVLIYFGSFLRVYPGKSVNEIKDEIRRVLLHELRHHWEGLSGERALEIEDEKNIESYLKAHGRQEKR